MADAKSIGAFCWWAVAILSVIGLGIATYLSVLYVSGAAAACGAGGGCSAVAASDYAKLFGVPVAFLGVGGYSLILLGSLAVIGGIEFLIESRYLVLGLVGLGTVFSAYLTATQVFFIGSYCAYCLASASIMTVMLILAIMAVLIERKVAFES